MSTMTVMRGGGEGGEVGDVGGGGARDGEVLE